MPRNPEMPLARQWLIRYMDIAPAALSIVRSEEAALFAEQEFVEPILDVGSGDGVFANAVFSKRIDVGLDMSRSETAIARPKEAYKNFTLAKADAIPFPENTFATVVSNCVFEHIPEIEGTFAEIARVLTPGGKFIFTAHSHLYDESLLYPNLFRALGLRQLRDWYVGMMNNVFRHYNCYSPEQWSDLLTNVGLEVNHCQYYLPPQNLRRFDLILPLSVPAMLNKKLFGRWLFFPMGWLGKLAGDFLQPHSGEHVERGAALFFVVTKPK